MIETHKYNGELKLYRANIYDNVKTGDDRLQVRIMPYMAGITGEDEANLPKYPPLYKGHVIRGYAEVDSAENNGLITSIMVLANEDFTVGYCLDPINEFNGALSGGLRTSWNYQEAKSVLQRCGCVPKNFTYDNITCNINDKGTFMEMGSYTEPFKVWMTEAGDVFVIQKNRLYMMARSGVESGVDSSYIDIKPNRIEIKSKVVDLSKSDAVILGHRGMSVVATFAETAVPCEGINLAPCTSVKI